MLEHLSGPLTTQLRENLMASNILRAALALALCLSLVACGGGGSEDEEEGAPPEQQTIQPVHCSASMPNCL